MGHKQKSIIAFLHYTKWAVNNSKFINFTSISRKGLEPRPRLTVVEAVDSKKVARLRELQSDMMEIDEHNAANYDLDPEPEQVRNS